MENITHEVMDSSGSLLISNESAPELHITAFGDLDFHDNVDAYIKRNGPEGLFDGVKDFFPPDSIKIANLETVLLKRPIIQETRKALLVSDTSSIETLKNIGIDLLSFANNHVLDAGPEGLIECIKNIEQSGIKIYGSGPNEQEARKPAVITINGITLAFFAYADGMGQVAGSDRPGCAEALFDKILEDIGQYTNLDRTIVVISLHMDAEFQEAPSPARIELCRQLAEAGAHIILCHHPHVPQGIENWNNSLIVYSLGNYVTPISPYMLAHSDICHKSFHINIGINGKGVTKADVAPVVINKDGLPVLAQSSDRTDILQLIAARSEILKQEPRLIHNYRVMTRTWLKKTLGTLYWAARNRDFTIIKSIAVEILNTRVKRRWLRDALYCPSVGKKAL
jgi:poly-gamma-glutamate capsule biosynthesis protein CapA/YwtB (metallophosphatase superfamily)